MRGSRPLWKGESFYQYDPHGAEARRCPESEEVWKKVRKPRPGLKSRIAKLVPVADRRRAVEVELDRARVAFRLVTNRTNARTIIACLLPPDLFLATALSTSPLLTETKRPRRRVWGL